MKKIIKNFAIVLALASLTSCAQEEGGDIIGGSINSTEPFDGTSMEWIAQEELTAQVAAIFEKAGLTEEINKPNTTLLCPTQYAINRTVRRHNSVNHRAEWQRDQYANTEKWTIDMMTEEELQMMKMYIFPDVVVDRQALAEAGDDGIIIKSLPYWIWINKENPNYVDISKLDSEKDKDKIALYTAWPSPQYVWTAEYEAYITVTNWIAYEKAVADWEKMSAEEQAAATAPIKPWTGDPATSKIDAVKELYAAYVNDKEKPTKPLDTYVRIKKENIQQEVRLTLDPTNTNGNAAYEGAGLPGVGYQYSNFLMSTPEIIHMLFKRGENWEIKVDERAKYDYQGNECDGFYCVYYSDVHTSNGVIHTVYVSDATYNERLHSHTLLFYGTRADDAVL